jgi:hypothetical protein
VSCLGLGGQRAKLSGGAGEIALEFLRHEEAPAALARGEPVADHFGEISSFLTGCARRERVTRHGCRARLPGQDLAQPPRIA